MHIFTAFLIVLTLRLLTPSILASPTLAPSSRSDASKTSPPNDGPKVQEPEALKAQPPQLASRVTPPQPESDQPQSLTIIPRRDISRIKQIVHTTWENFIPFTKASLQQAFPIMKATFSRILDIIAGQDARAQYAQALAITFAYGAMEVTLRCTNQVVAWTWDLVREIMEFINDKIIAGLAGFFRADFLTLAGLAIVVSYTAIVGAIFWLARIPPDPFSYVG